jgi:ankyrin repeat protein
MQPPGVAVGLTEAGPCRVPQPVTVSLTPAEQSVRDGDDAFLKAVHAGDVREVERLLAAGQKINVGNEKKESTMHLAILGLTTRAVQEFTVSEETALLDMLVRHGAFADYVDATGKRPMNLCFDKLEFGVPFAAFLLGLRDATGALVVDLRATRPIDGNTVLHDIAWTGNVKCMQLVLQTHACDDMIEAMNKQGQTALHVAAFRSAKELVMLLTAAGADHTKVERNPRRLSRETAEDIALNMGRDDTANYLRSLNVTVYAVSAAAKLKKGAKGK